jgi:hypothetical protein
MSAHCNGSVVHVFSARLSGSALGVEGFMNVVEKVEFFGQVFTGRRDGESLLRLAARHGINYDTLLRWKKRLSGRAERGQLPLAPPETLLPVELVGSSTSSGPVISVLSIGGAPPEGAFLLKLRSGHEVRVPCGFDVNELRCLVTTLEGSPCS